MTEEKPANASAGVDELSAALELSRRDSAGKDKRITEYQKQLTEMQAKLAEASGDADERLEDVARLRELVGRIKEREGAVDAQEAAIRTAIERGVPPSLAARNAGSLDQLLAELAEYEATLAKRRRKVSTWTDQHGKKHLSAADAQGFSRRELARIPPDILARLAEEGQG